MSDLYGPDEVRILRVCNNQIFTFRKLTEHRFDSTNNTNIPITFIWALILHPVIGVGRTESVIKF